MKGIRMNQHFRRVENEKTLEGANRMYAQIERVEPPLVEGGHWLICFDAISIRWINDQNDRGDPRFNLADHLAVRAAWLRDGELRRRGRDVANPLEGAPLFRIDIILPNLEAMNENFRRFLQRPGFTIDESPESHSQFEAIWVELRTGTPGNGFSARIYPNAFSAPFEVNLDVGPVHLDTVRALREIVTLDDFETIDTPGCENLLNGRMAESL